MTSEVGGKVSCLSKTIITKAFQREESEQNPVKISNKSGMMKIENWYFNLANGNHWWYWQELCQWHNQGESITEVNLRDVRKWGLGDYEYRKIIQRP